MMHRIIEVATDHRHLSVFRGFIVIEDNSSSHIEIGRIPLDDVGAVIVSAHGITYTNNFLVELAKRTIPFVLCASDFKPIGMLLSLDGNHEQARRFDAQANSSRPKVKQLWASIVRSKLEQQAATLACLGKVHAPLLNFAKRVRSGDPDNIEAQGAKHYWTLLFGDDFRRDRTAEGANAMLNYGYTILRAATARAVVAAGLHPTPSLHHSNAGNPMRLVDDLMEPFRPVIDRAVFEMLECGEHTITPIVKKTLVESLFKDLPTDRGITPAAVCIQRLATSLAQVFLGERQTLDLPLIAANMPVENLGK